jgi:dTDP-4-amino-4,6-dideoxygalactose transaminase
MNIDTTLAINGGHPVLMPGKIKKWPPIETADRLMVLDSLNEGVHSFGPNCKLLQEEFAAWNGNRYALTTNSGTAALHMCVAACGCGAGDEVIVPAYSWSSSATCVLQHNAIPVFVDIDFDTMNIDVNKIEQAITEKTKAIIAVHLHGLTVDMVPVIQIARKYGLKVIEDACQAHGAEYHGDKAGCLGDCAAFSFNQNKNLCSGEGGMFVTQNEELFKQAQSLWSFGETRSPLQSRDYHVYAMGWMYRNNDLTAAFGRAQLARLDNNLRHQIKNAQYLTKQLMDVPGLILPTEPMGFKHNWYNYVLRFDMEKLGMEHNQAAFRDKILNALQAEGVPAVVWQKFILPAMTVFQAKNGYGGGCPWMCHMAEPVCYDLDQYPMAQKHCDAHICLVMALRAPNGADVVDLLAQGIRKVMANINQIR